MRSLVLSLSLTAGLCAAPLAQAPARHFLWTVTAPGAPPSYLVGSLHVLTPAYYPLAPKIEQAFASSTVLIEEVDFDELRDPATLSAVASKALLPPETTLAQVIGPDLYAGVIARIEKAGLPRAALERMKPWMVAVALAAPVMQAAGFDAAHGVDRHFFDRAVRAGMERRALETAAFQFDRLDRMAAADQEAMLRASLEDLDTQMTNVKSLAEGWARGDTAMVEHILLQTTRESPALYQRLLVDRNAAWVASVEACVAQKVSCFVVVGAAHLVGPDSLVSFLRKKGYTIEQQ